MTRQAIRTEDLGLGWFASENNDGSMTVRNPDIGQRIELEPDSVERLRQCFRDAAALKSGVAYSIEEARRLFGEDFDSCWNPTTEAWEYAATTHAAA